MFMFGRAIKMLESELDFMDTAFLRVLLDL